jgi:hypothetical protein
MSNLTFHGRDSLYALGFDVQKEAARAQIRSYNHFMSATEAGRETSAQARGVYDETGISIRSGRHGGVDTPSGFSDTAFEMWKDIPGLFVQFAGSNPHDFEPAISALSEAAYCVHMDLAPSRASGGDGYAVPETFRAPDEPISTRVGNIKHLMQGWNGRAAGAFAGYMSKLPAAAELQSGVSLSMAAALAGRQQLLSAAYADIWTIGTKTRDVLRAWGTCDGETATVVTLSVVGVLATIVSEVATLGFATPELVAAGAAIGSGVAGLAGTFASVDLGGASVPRIISNMKVAIKKLVGAMKNENDMVNDLLGRVAARANQSRNFISIPEPDALYAVEKSDVSHLETRNGFYDE